MITTMFYYNHYKPYIFQAKKIDRTPYNQKKSDENKSKVPDAESKRLLLNKAFNNDVVSYAHNVSYNLTSLKDSAKYINYDIDDFELNEQKYGFENTKESFKSSLETFVNSFNRAYSFYSSQKHSQSLVDFSIDMDNTIISNMETLADLGIGMDDENKIVFSTKAYDALEHDELAYHVNESRQVFESIYNKSSSMLSVPLADHMNFKNLSYYYNYKFGGLMSDTFKIIESGLIIDKVV